MCMEVKAVTEALHWLELTTYRHVVVVTDSMSDLDAADVLLLAVPMQKLRSFLNDQRDALQGKALVACCKGIEIANGVGSGSV